MEILWAIGNHLLSGASGVRKLSNSPSFRFRVYNIFQYLGYFQCTTKGKAENCGQITQHWYLKNNANEPFHWVFCTANMSKLYRTFEVNARLVNRIYAVKDSPAQMENSPAQMENSPAQMENSPAQMENSPAQMENLKQKMWPDNTTLVS